MKSFLIAAGLLLAAAAAWFFVSPLFIERVVDEELPGLEAVPSRAEVDVMPAAQRAALRTQLMAAAADSPGQAMDEPMRPAMAETPLVLASGKFSDADAIHKGSGNASVYRLPDGSDVIRLDTFRVTNGPALVVLLADAENPQSAAEVKEGGFISLGKLKGNSGNQNYPVPEGVNATDFGSVVIWCELFDVLFSAAPLTRT